MSQPFEELEAFRSPTPEEGHALERLLEVASSDARSPRASPLHLTGSALVVHPPTRRMLLRWHPRLGRWMQVGGHGDEGEADPFEVARREAEEETGLVDLHPYPQRQLPEIIQVAVVDVPASASEPAHQHGDVRYLLATGTPEQIHEESPDAPLRWCDEAAALDLVSEENLRTLIIRTAQVLDDSGGA